MFLQPLSLKFLDALLLYNNCNHVIKNSLVTTRNLIPQKSVILVILLGGVHGHLVVVLYQDDAAILDHNTTYL